MSRPRVQGLPRSYAIPVMRSNDRRTGLIPMAVNSSAPTTSFRDCITSSYMFAPSRKGEDDEVSEQIRCARGPGLALAFATATTDF